MAMSGAGRRRKGANFENDVRKTLNTNGFPAASRLAAPGEERDLGDIGNVPGWTIECKNQKDIRLGEWMVQMKLAQERGETRWGAVVAKRRMLPLRDAYVVMSFEDWVDVLRCLKDAGLPVGERARWSLRDPGDE